jgi:serine/threonine protein kinase
MSGRRNVKASLNRDTTRVSSNSRKTNVQRSEPNKNVGEDYPLERQIGKGSFGFVYRGCHRRTGANFACKAEKKTNSSKERLRAEYNLYKVFRKNHIACVPRVDTFLVTEDWNLMMMQLLGKSLDVVFSDGGNQLDLGTVMSIGLMMIDGLEEIHKCGVIHRDIKPNNFMFGRVEDEEDSRLYIVDFGLSKFWRDPRTGIHISQKHGRSMIGTARYASINIHCGIEPSRRDDLESMGYVLVYLAKGRLPWQGLQKRRKGSSIDEIKDKKMSTTTEDLCTGLPPCFKTLIDYAKALSFHQAPNYDLMRQTILKSAKEDSIDIILAWDCDNGGDVDIDDFEN